MIEKSVKAPLTYNPGKGRPKEYLAYLNYQEMQALKRLNGNNMERGPKGLPSFPPADAIGSSSRASSTKKSGPSSSLNAPARTAPSTSRTTTRGPAASMAAARQGSSVSKGNAVTARQGSPVSKNPAGGGARDSGRATASTDRAFKQAAEQKRASKALSNPALKQDAGRSAIGGISKDKSVGLADGSRIRGAIQNIQETAAEAALRRQGPIGPTPQQYKTVEDFNRAFAQELANKQFARTGYSPQELNRLAQGVYGEAAAEGYRGMNPAARSIVNSIAGGIEVPSYSYLGGSDFDKLADRYTVFQDPNKPFKSAGIGSLNQTQGLFSLAQAASPESAFSKAADISDRIKNATHYYAQDIVKPSWADKSFERYGQHTFGTADAVSEKRIAAAREKIFGEPSYSTTGTVITPTSSTPERSAVPGLIQYPRLDRPMAPTAGRSAVIPTSRKSITDRIAPEYPRISADPTIAGKDLTPRGKQIYDRIISESGDLPISIGGDVRQAFGAGAFGTGQISVPPSGIDASGSIAGSAGYSQDVIRDVYAGSVSPSRFRSATQVAAEFPSPIRPVGTIGGIAGLGAMPEPISVPVSKADALVRGAPGVGTRASGNLQFSNVGLGGEIAGVPGISPDVTSATATVSAAEREKIPGLMRVSNIFAAGSPADLARNLRGQITEGYETFRTENVAESVSPSQESAPPSQDVTLSPEAEQAQEETRKKAKTTRRGAQTILNLAIPGAGTVAGLAFGALDRQVQKLVDAYQSAGMTERKAMEEKYPNLIPRAQAMGINSYYDMDKYYAWAEKSGLRGTPSREGGGPGGIASLGGGSRDDDQTSVSPTPDTPSTPSGRRPDIYYMWDLGVNIPSPSDPNYTQYQTYLAERLAAQQAMGFV